MINILLDVLDFSTNFLYEDLKRHIYPSDKVVILAFSYRDREVQNLRAWKMLYRENGGRYYENMVSLFLQYGISADQIELDQLLYGCKIQSGRTSSQCRYTLSAWRNAGSDDGTNR